MRGTARLILGDEDGAIADLTAVAEGEASQPVTVAHSQLAVLAIRRGAWTDAAHHAVAGEAMIKEAGLGDYATSALVYAATAEWPCMRGARRMHVLR